MARRRTDFFGILVAASLGALAFKVIDVYVWPRISSLLPGVSSS